MSEPSKLIIDYMDSNTSYLKEELAYRSNLSLGDVVGQLKKFQADGEIELTNTNGMEFWSKKDATKEHR